MKKLELNEEEAKAFKKIHQDVGDPIASTSKLLDEIECQLLVLKSIRRKLMNVRRNQERRIRDK